LKHLVELYDAEIFHADFILGKIIGLLRTNSLWDDTVLIVTSDHGENFGKNGHILHHFTLYEDTTQVPLIIRYPRKIAPGSRDEGLVQLPDLFPTLLGLAGISAKSYKPQGIDLLSDIPRDQRIIFTECYRPRRYIAEMEEISQNDEERARAQKYSRRIRSIIAGNLKFIWASDGAHEMYDLSQDPEESYNLATNQRFTKVQIRALDTLLNEIDRLVARRSKPLHGFSVPSDAVLDPETKEALKALGYF
jgi:arylsulfatase A-like enzyme